MTDEENSQINWSEKRYFDMLIDQRKFMWKEELLDVYSAWLGLEQGMTAVDLGCGLGFLGYTYWRYFGRGGRYYGLDLDRNLLAKANAAAKDWAQDGAA